MRIAWLSAAFVVTLCVGTPAAGSTRLIDVPFVPQSEELCGGAAVSMVMRYWAATDVYAEDFAALVEKTAGGIRLGALAGSVRRRGWQAHVFAATPRDVQAHLEGGRPVIALIEDRPGRLHYVVLVAWTNDRIVFHDSAVNPFRTMSVSAFDRRWQTTDYAALLVLPPESMRAPSRWTGEREVPSGDEPRHRAGALFLEKRYADAAALAGVAVADDPDDLAAWQLLAASRFLDGDADGALDAWNQRGEPRVDLARIEGLSRTRHDVVADLLDLPPRSVITRQQLARAERRVAALPSAQLSRVGYTPHENGTASVDAAIVERPLLPASRAAIVATAAYAATMREARVNVASPSGEGEMWTAAVRWWEGRPRTAVSMTFPKLAGWSGLWRADGSWERQGYSSPGGSTMSERRHAGISFGDWASGRMRWRLGASLDRWSGTGTVASISGELERRMLDDRVATMADASVSARFATAAISARWRSSREPLSGWHSTATVATVTAAAPLDFWPGGDTGVARPTLLRAHPLLDDGVIRTAGLHRVLPHASLEYRRQMTQHPMGQLGWAAFVDATTTHVDAGLGLRFRLPAAASVLRLDLARGIRDGAVAFSVGWQPSW